MHARLAFRSSSLSLAIAVWLLTALSGLAGGVAAAQPPDAHDETDRAPFLNVYVGRYELSDRFFLDITRVGDALYVQATGQEAMQLTPRSEAEFVIVGTSLRLMFQVDPFTGEVPYLVFEQGGFGRQARKLEAADVPVAPVAITLAEDALGRYVGTYEEQPGFAITVSLEDGRLVAGFTEQDREPILPESETEFFYETSTARLSFELEGSGQASRLILHQGGSDVTMTRRDD